VHAENEKDVPGADESAHILTRSLQHGPHDHDHRTREHGDATSHPVGEVRHQGKNGNATDALDYSEKSELMVGYNSGRCELC